MTVRQAARVLGVDPSTIYKWTHNGTLKSTKGPGHFGRRFVDPTSVEAMRDAPRRRRRGRKLTHSEVRQFNCDLPAAIHEEMSGLIESLKGTPLNLTMTDFAVSALRHELVNLRTTLARIVKA